MQHHAKHFNRNHRTIPDTFDDRLKLSKNHPAIIFENRTITFNELNDLSNQIAEWGLNVAKLQPGDVVGLLCDNCIEYIAIWLGLSKIGCTTSLINTNLKGDPLLHSFTVVETKLIISGLSNNLSDNVNEIKSKLLEHNNQLQFWYINDTGNHNIAIKHYGLQSLNDSLTQFNIKSGDTSYNHKYHQLRQQAKLNSSNLLFYIYTSGTTGLPKAAKIKHTRMFLAGISFVTMHALNKRDILYVSMPLYHSAAGMIGVGVSWLGGITIVLRRKFSAKSFMSDCAIHNVTVIQYIGQICRYLISTEPSRYDKQHKIKKAIG